MILNSTLRRHIVWSRAGAKNTEKSTAMRLWPWTRWPQPAPANQNSVQAKQDYEQYNAYSQLLDRNGQWIGVADTKAGAILAFVIVAFPLFASSALPVFQRIINAI